MLLASRRTMLHPTYNNADNVFLLQITSDKNAALLRDDSDWNSVLREAAL